MNDSLIPKENLKTDCNIQPVNNRLLLKIVTNNYPTMYAISGKKPDESIDYKAYISGTSNPNYKLGEEVLIDNQTSMSNKVIVKDNEQSITNVKLFLNSLDREECESYLKKKPRITLVEYVIIHEASIIAKIK